MCKKIESFSVTFISQKINIMFIILDGHELQKATHKLWTEPVVSWVVRVVATHIIITRILVTAGTFLNIG